METRAYSKSLLALTINNYWDLVQIITIRGQLLACYQTFIEAAPMSE